MLSETKKVLGTIEEKLPYTDRDSAFATLTNINVALLNAENFLQAVGLGVGYTDHTDQIENSVESFQKLKNYTYNLEEYTKEKLDAPFKKELANGATETISRIRLENYGVENTHRVTVNSYDYAWGTDLGSTDDPNGILTFQCFMGYSTDEMDSYHLPTGDVPEFSSIFKDQYQSMVDNGLIDATTSLTDYLKQFGDQGSFDHSMDKPFESFVSDVLDITIVKPLIESCCGYDLITGEDLSDSEMALKFVSAVVGLCTLGIAAEGVDLAEMGSKQAIIYFAKMAAVDVASQTASCAIGAIGEANDWPIALTIALSLFAGVSVSMAGTNIVINSGSYTKEIPVVFSTEDLTSMTESERQAFFNSLTDEQAYVLASRSGFKNLSGYDLITTENAKDFFLLIDKNGKAVIVIDWPKYGGFEPSTIDSIDNLPSKVYVSRSGSVYGHTLGYELNGTDLATNGERAIPTSQSVVRTGEMDVDRYCDIIDALTNNKDESAQIAALSKMGLSKETSEKLISEYSSYLTSAEVSGENSITDGLNSVNKSVSGTYGYSGQAASWDVGDVVMGGGANQLTTTFSWQTMVDSGVISNVGCKTVY